MIFTSLSYARRAEILECVAADMDFEANHSTSPAAAQELRLTADWFRALAKPYRDKPTYHIDDLKNP